MKMIRKLKVTLIALVLITVSGFTQAQELGIRFGSNWGNNAAIDAIFSAGKYSRIHADLSFGGGVSAEALWDFVYRPVGGNEFNWYAGVGVSTFLGTSNKYDYNSSFQLGIPGEIGLEYQFRNAPLSLSIDWRPVFVLVQKTQLNAGEFGLNFRYVFGR
jgi:hypothetical protein